MLINSPYMGYTALWRRRCEWMQAAVTVVCVAVQGIASIRRIWV